jgi:hypothetical protein
MSVESSIIQVLQELAPNTSFILPYRNGVEPQSVYCLVMVLSKDNVGRNEDSMYNTGGKQTISQNIMCSVRLQYFGDSKSTAQSDAEIMSMLLDTHTARSLLWHQGLSISDIDGIKQAGVIRDTKHYMTHIFDITLLYKQTISIDAPTIDTLNTEATLSITGNIDDLVVNSETELE